MRANELSGGPERPTNTYNGGLTGSGRIPKTPPRTASHWNALHTPSATIRMHASCRRVRHKIPRLPSDSHNDPCCAVGARRSILRELRRSTPTVHKLYPAFERTPDHLLNSPCVLAPAELPHTCAYVRKPLQYFRMRRETRDRAQ